MAAILAHPDGKPLLSDEYFSVDGTLIKAWASMKSFQPKEGRATPDNEDPGGPPPPADETSANTDQPQQTETQPMTDTSRQTRNAEVNFRGEKRSNAIHASVTDPDASLYKKAPGTAAMLCFMGHSPGSTRRRMLGADKGYYSADFVAELRRMVVTPHVAQKARHSTIDGRNTGHPGYAMSQRHRKKIEEPFGWAKTIGSIAQTVHRGLERGRAQFTMTMAACNLARPPKLLGT